MRLQSVVMILHIFNSQDYFLFSWKKIIYIFKVNAIQFYSFPSVSYNVAHTGHEPVLGWFGDHCSCTDTESWGKWKKYHYRRKCSLMICSPNFFCGFGFLAWLWCHLADCDSTGTSQFSSPVHRCCSRTLRTDSAEQHYKPLIIVKCFTWWLSHDVSQPPLHPPRQIEQIMTVHASHSFLSASLEFWGCVIVLFGVFLCARTHLYSSVLLYICTPMLYLPTVCRCSGVDCSSLEKQKKTGQHHRPRVPVSLQLLSAKLLWKHKCVCRWSCVRELFFLLGLMRHVIPSGRANMLHAFASCPETRQRSFLKMV